MQKDNLPKFDSVSEKLKTAFGDVGKSLSDARIDEAVDSISDDVKGSTETVINETVDIASGSVRSPGTESGASVVALNNAATQAKTDETNINNLINEEIDYDDSNQEQANILGTSHTEIDNCLKGLGDMSNKEVKTFAKSDEAVNTRADQETINTQASVKANMQKQAAGQENVVKEESAQSSITNLINIQEPS